MTSLEETLDRIAEKKDVDDTSSEQRRNVASMLFKTALEGVYGNLPFGSVVKTTVYREKKGTWLFDPNEEKFEYFYSSSIEFDGGVTIVSPYYYLDNGVLVKRVATESWTANRPGTERLGKFNTFIDAAYFALR